jgi:hypothetical protein
MSPMKYAFLVLIIFVSACSSSPPSKSTGQEITSMNRVIINNSALSKELFYSRCVSRYKNKNYIDLHAKCSCESDAFSKFGINIEAVSNQCGKYNVREGDQIVEPTDLCSSTATFKKLTLGNLIQQYRTYDRDGWVNGVKAKHASNLWLVKSITDEDVELELVKGNYYGKSVGDIVKSSNSPLYDRQFPETAKYDQVVNSYRNCVNANL